MDHEFGSSRDSRAPRLAGGELRLHRFRRQLETGARVPAQRRQRDITPSRTKATEMVVETSQPNDAVGAPAFAWQRTDQGIEERLARMANVLANKIAGPTVDAAWREIGRTWPDQSFSDLASIANKIEMMPRTMSDAALVTIHLADLHKQVFGIAVEGIARKAIGEIFTHALVAATMPHLRPLVMGIRLIGAIAGINRGGKDSLRYNACARDLAREASKKVLRKTIENVIVSKRGKQRAVRIKEPSRSRISIEVRRSTDISLELSLSRRVREASISRRAVAPVWSVRTSRVQPDDRSIERDIKRQRKRIGGPTISL